MTNIRVHHEKNYTCIHNDAIRDKRLSWKARGIHHFLLSHPDNWTVNTQYLVSQSNEGRTAVLAALKELEEYGYLTRKQIKNESGQFSGWESVLTELPTESRKPDYGEETAVRFSDNGLSDHRLSDHGKPDCIISNEKTTSIELLTSIDPEEVISPAASKNEIEVEILDPEPVPKCESLQVSFTQSFPGKQLNSDRGQFSAAEPENLKILQEAQAIAFDWRKRPWMLNAVELKPEASTSVWMSNTEFYSLDNGSPNYKLINDRLKKLDKSLKGINEQAALAYIELTNYWKTASSLINPESGVNAQQYKSDAKQMTEQMKRRSRQADIEAALKHL